MIFFFQAEDGIRDLYVTGVQTCALPISALDDEITRTGANAHTDRATCVRVRASTRDLVIERREHHRPAHGSRSEVRRVGKVYTLMRAFEMSIITTKRKVLSLTDQD